MPPRPPQGERQSSLSPVSHTRHRSLLSAAGTAGCPEAPTGAGTQVGRWRGWVPEDRLPAWCLGPRTGKAGGGLSASACARTRALARVPACVPADTRSHRDFVGVLCDTRQGRLPCAPPWACPGVRGLQGTGPRLQGNQGDEHVGPETPPSSS